MQDIVSFKIKGMQRDPSPSAFDSSYSFENKNIRIISKAEEGLFLSATNEQGTLPIKFYDIENQEISISGTVIGYCILGIYLVIFTSGDDDYIYKATRIDNSNFPSEFESWKLEVLYKGNLSFDPDYPIEAIPYDENELNKKVYWIDGKNQPRYINILQQNTSYDDTSFDFVGLDYNYNSNINVTIDRSDNDSSPGQLHSGTILFLITAINNYDRESAPIYISPLYYIAEQGKGSSPDEILNTSFNINLDFDKESDIINIKTIKIYSIARSAKNEQPTINVAKLNIEDTFKKENTTSYFIGMTTSTNASYIYNSNNKNILFAYNTYIKDGTTILDNCDNYHIPDDISFKFNVSTKPLYRTVTEELAVRDDQDGIIIDCPDIKYNNNGIVSAYSNFCNFRFIAYNQITKEWSWFENSSEGYSNSNNSRHTMEIRSRHKLDIYIKNKETNEIFAAYKNGSNTDVTSTTDEFIYTIKCFQKQYHDNYENIEFKFNIQQQGSAANIKNDVDIIKIIPEDVIIIERKYGNTKIQRYNRNEFVPLVEGFIYKYDLTTKNLTIADGSTIYYYTGLEGVNASSLNYLYSGANLAFADVSEVTNLNKYIINPYTITTKDNVLFLGNYEIKSIMLSREQEKEIKSEMSAISFSVDDSRILNLGNKNNDTIDRDNNKYIYKNQLLLNSRNIKYFKKGETYRFAIQLIDMYGNTQNIVYLDDVKNYRNIEIIEKDGTTYAKLPYAKTTIPKTLTDKLRKLGFYKIKPLVCYPSKFERQCIAQGVLSPTVFNLEDRINNKAYAQSSWFHRPIISETKYSEDEFNTSNKESDKYTTCGSIVKFKDYDCISGYESPSVEVLLNHTSKGTTINKIVDIKDEEADPSNNAYFIDQNILTFHSPDIEFDDDFRSYSIENYKLKIVGIVPLNTSIIYKNVYPKGSAGFYSSVKQHDSIHYSDLSYTDPIYASGDTDYWYGGGQELVNGSSIESSTKQPYKKLISDTTFRVAMGYNNADDYTMINHLFPHVPVYLWGTSDVAEVNNSDILSHDKIISNLQFSTSNIYFEDKDVYTPDIDNLNIKLIDANINKKIFRLGNNNYYYLDSVSKIETETPNKFPVLNYRVAYGRVSSSTGTAEPADTSAGMFGIPLFEVSYYRDNTSSSSTHISNASKLFNYRDYRNDKYRVSDFVLKTNNIYERYTSYMLTPAYATYGNIDTNPVLYVKSNWEKAVTPVEIKYKSTNHALLNLGIENNNRLILPNIKVGDDLYNIMSTEYNKEYSVPWSSDTQLFKNIQHTINLDTKYSTSCANGFFYLAELYTDAKLAQKNTEDILWLSAGDEVVLDSDNSIELSWIEGDTYYQRYDNLKTYQYDINDTNGVVDILSFMCETHINLDGRYDINRGLNDNTEVNPSNFNLINLAYSQDNNFYSYNYIPHEMREMKNNVNQITWGSSKVYNSPEDTWVDVRLSSVVNLNGEFGKLLKLSNFQDNIITFQERAICELLYNSKYQLQTTQGINIDIANSNKMDGYRVLSNMGIGSKYHVCKTPINIYFVDTFSKELYSMSNIQTSMSSLLKVSSWFKKSFDYSDSWNINKWNNNIKSYILQYDFSMRDLYVISKDDCLSISEVLGSAQSFFDYNNTPYILNIHDSTYCIHDNTLFKMYSGKFNEFFGTPKPYYIEYVVNKDALKTKIFDTVEYLGDIFEYDSNAKKYVINHKNTFDTLEVKNEYQYGISDICKKVGDSYEYNNIRKKFRQWRALIPREQNTRNRIVNPWIKLKISKNNPGNELCVLNSLNVKYSTVP